MMISTKGRYALRLMVDLAMHGTGENIIPLKEISQRQNISIKYLEQIVSSLSKEGLLISVRGAHGGHRLAKPPEDYSAGEILRAIEGNLSPVACLSGDSNDCPRVDQCVTLDFWQGLHFAVTSYIDSVTLADIIKDKMDLTSLSRED